MTNKHYRICVVSSTRADWGLLRPVADALRHHPAVEVCVVATNMHLQERYGMTVREIESDGFDVAWKVPMEVAGDDEASRVRAMSLCMSGMADAFLSLRPDAVLLLGDRYEMLAVASAAAVMRIPIIHIAGGEVSLGAVDDAIRHAISKLSTLHLTATEPYRRRVIQMGAQPDMVVNTGAIGVWNAFNMPILSAAELGADLGMDFSRPVALVTYHPATCDDTDPDVRVSAMLEAFEAFPDLTYLITYPNNDARSGDIISRLETFAATHPGRVRLVRSLGALLYQSALRHCALVAGNSSSGIVEAPSAGIPTVDIGIRQAGRLAGPSVIHCGESAADIRAAIARALSPGMQAIAARRENPYYRPDTLACMTDAIMSFLGTLPARPLPFYDLEPVR